nr:MAG TPA: hypothetical protein [Caudoviricetes sp.]
MKFNFFKKKKGSIKIKQPLTYRKKIEVKVIEPEWKRYIEI